MVSVCGSCDLAIGAAACGSTPPAEKSAVPAWERENPIKPLAPPPLGMELYFEDVKPPTPARVRLGRWLFYDTRLSGDNTVACASCHKPEHAFSEPTPVSSGHPGSEGRPQGAELHQPGGDAVPALLLGRPRGLARGSGARADRQPDRDGQYAIETMIATLTRMPGYTAVFHRSVRHAGDHQGARRQGDCRLRAHAHERQLAVGSLAIQPRRRTPCPRRSKQGHELFHGKADCGQCHLGNNFTDGQFHNLGVGWIAKTKTFKDEGRLGDHEGSRRRGRPGDRGAFKTPTLREVTKHAAVHARRLDRDAARGRRALQPRRRREPVAAIRRSSRSS